MAVAAMQIDTGHSDLVHDSQFDYYGRRLATCSSDGLVRVFSIEGEHSQHVADLRGHQGPVWQVAWGHPKYGNLLASCSFDHSVIVWKEVADGSWQIIHKTDANLHTGSINGVAWAPFEAGLIFAAASSDGNVSVHSCNTQTGQWNVTYVQSENSAPAHPLGVTAVAFAPALEAGALVSNRSSKQGPVLRLASSGCDNAVRLWSCGQDGVWRQEGRPLVGHMDWVRDVQWAPNLGLPRTSLASCSQDGKVLVWMEEASNPGVWKQALVHDYGKDHLVSSVSWSATANVLAVSVCGASDVDADVHLYKEAVDGVWERFSDTQ